MQNLKTICIICARGGSKGLPRKNIKLLDGKPLIARPIEDSINSGVVDTTLVTTDDIEIAEIAKEWGAVVPFIRPKELATDLATTEETLQHALLTYEEMTKSLFDICVFLTPTDIFREISWIQRCVEILKDNESIESVFVGNETHKNYWEQTEDGNWQRLRPWMKTYSSRQVQQKIIREDTGLACASRAWLWRAGRRIGDNVEILLSRDPFTMIDVHTQEDLDLAQSALELRMTSR